MAKSKPDTRPLTDDDLKTLNKVLKACADTEAYCDKCEACGIDTAPERKKNREQASIAAKIKAAWFPHAQ